MRVAYLLLFVATTAIGANDDSDEQKEKALRFVPLVTSTPLTGTGVDAALRERGFCQVPGAGRSPI